jgi:hypothetical protein
LGFIGLDTENTEGQRKQRIIFGVSIDLSDWTQRARRGRDTQRIIFGVSGDIRLKYGYE